MLSAYCQQTCEHFKKKNFAVIYAQRYQPIKENNPEPFNSLLLCDYIEKCWVSFWAIFFTFQTLSRLFVAVRMKSLKAGLTFSGAGSLENSAARRGAQDAQQEETNPHVVVFAHESAFIASRREKKRQTLLQTKRRVKVLTWRLCVPRDEVTVIHRQTDRLTDGRTGALMRSRRLPLLLAGCCPKDPLCCNPALLFPLLLRGRQSRGQGVSSDW